MDRRRFRNRDAAQKLRGCKLDNFFRVLSVPESRLKKKRFDLVIPIYLFGLVRILPSCSRYATPLVSLQALTQELNFAAYLGVPVFMISIRGPHNANLARVLLNHVHTGHHTSNVRRSGCVSDGREVGRMFVVSPPSLSSHSVLDTRPAVGLGGCAGGLDRGRAADLRRRLERRREDLGLVGSGPLPGQPRGLSTR